MDKKYVCPCGLTCCDCMFHKKEIFVTAQKLKELISQHKLDKFLTLCSNKNSWTVMGEHLDLRDEQLWEGIGKQFDMFRQIPEFMNVLDGIIRLQCETTCQEAGGCTVGGNKYECKALKCLKARGYDGCWQCGEADNCDKLGFLKSSYGDVIKDNLQTIREKGIGAVESRGDKYYEWQRRGE